MPGNIRYGILILAGGNSSRLGEPKQLLVYRDKSLLQNVVDQGKKINDAVVVVVTGAWQSIVENEIAGKEVIVFHNAKWETGMASSIKTGVHGLCKLYPALTAVLIAVCDQPFLTNTILSSLIKKHIESGKGIIASAYNNTAGTPALFSTSYFHALLNLEGQEGAKKIIGKYTEDTACIDFPEGSIDIDTMEDYNRLIL